VGVRFDESPAGACPPEQSRRCEPCAIAGSAPGAATADSRLDPVGNAPTYAGNSPMEAMMMLSLRQTHAAFEARTWGYSG
jgi:hypothetical protein